MGATAPVDKRRNVEAEKITTPDNDNLKEHDEYFVHETVTTAVFKSLHKDIKCKVFDLKHSRLCKLFSFCSLNFEIY